ncbi:MAG: aldo/keto reductase [Candidatus Limnocylindrales bacterium]
MRAVSLPGLDRSISRIVLGMSASPEELPPLYDRFVELGGNAFETARWYPNEPVLGEWLAGRSDRDDLVVIGKGAHPSSQDGPPRVTPAGIADDLAVSLETLRTDRIELFELHRDDPAVPVGEIMAALAEHRAAGRIGATSGSNWSTDRLTEANAWAAAHGLPPFDAASPNLSLAVPTRPPWPGCLTAGDPASLAWYARTQLPLFAWAPLARGYFTAEPVDVAPIRRHAMIPLDQDIDAAAAFDSPTNRERRERARTLATELGWNANQVALAWVLNQPFPTWAIVGVRTVAQLEECVAAADLELSPGQVRWLATGDDR